MATEVRLGSQPEPRKLSDLPKSSLLSNPLVRAALGATLLAGTVGGIVIGRKTAESSTQPQPAAAPRTDQPSSNATAAENLPITIVPESRIENLPESVRPAIAQAPQPTESQPQQPLSSYMSEQPRMIGNAENPRPASSNIEAEKPIEIQAAIEGVNRWKLLLGTSQGNAYAARPNKGYLNVITEQIGHINNKPITGEDIVSGKVSDESNYIRVRWGQHRWLINYTNGQNLFGSAYGQAEIKNTKYITTQVNNLNNADRANGMQFSGQVQISYLTRFQGLLGPESEGDLFPKLPTPEFSYNPWVEETQFINVFKRNNKWSASLQEYKEIESPLEVIRRLDKEIGDPMNLSTIRDLKGGVRIGPLPPPGKGVDVFD
jgi:hypothetical protein